MDKFLEMYGELPEDLGFVEVDNDNAEMCFVQYLPIRIPTEIGSHSLPENLSWCSPLVGVACLTELLTKGNNWGYVYLTVKKVYGTGNREGWHCDGFGTDDINYIWYDKHPTEFHPLKLRLPRCHEESLKIMNTVIDEGDKVEYPCRHLVRMDQSSIHRVSTKGFSGLRTFVKISFSDNKYNLKGNAHNYLLDYKWSMVSRGVERNHPIGEIQ